MKRRNFYNTIPMTFALLLWVSRDNVLAQEGTRFYGCPMGHMMGWGGWAGMIFMVLFWILIIAAGIYLVKYLVQTTRGGRSNGRQDGSGRAIDILKQRYARGEIDKAEFETKKRDLQDETDTP